MKAKLKKNLMVLSGAGVSAESGLKTFRDAGNLWEEYAVEEVASPEGFKRNPDLVLRFYNERRRQLKNVIPNAAHHKIAELEAYFNVQVVTQNVDDLHERAGSTSVLHLHGELLKARPVDNSGKVFHWENDLSLGDTDENGVQLRPHIVWFGEAVPLMDDAMRIAEAADILLVIGTSLQVYPAAGLLYHVPEKCRIYLIDPNLENRFVQEDNFYKLSATAGMAALMPELIKLK